MKFSLRHFLLTVLMSTSVLLTAQQVPFVCQGDFYISIGVGNNDAQFYTISIDQITGGVNFTALPQLAGVPINGTGYRSVDNFIYGIDIDNQDFYRVDTTGVAVFLTALALPTSSRYYTADITPDGKSWVTLEEVRSGGSRSHRTAHLVDLTTGTYGITTVDLFTQSSGGTQRPTGRTADFAFEPSTGLLYGFDNTNGKLITIDLATGIWDDQRYPTVNTVDGFSSCFFDSFGNLYGYGYLGFGGTDKLFRADLNTGAITQIATGPTATGSDGCSCPYTVEIKKTANTPYTFPCTRVKYTFDISNLTGAPQSNIDFYDAMDPNFTIVSIDKNPFGGNVISGPGSNILDIRNLTVPLGKDSLVITVEVSATANGVYPNQAALNGLPATVGGFALSDDPATIASDDSTDITVTPLHIDFPNDTLIWCPGDTILIDATEPGVTYLWHDGSTDSVFHATAPGLYTVTIFNLCQQTAADTVYLIGPPVMTPNAIIDSVSCKGTNTGRIEINPTGGYGTPYSYSWSHAAGLNSRIAQNLGAGPYTVTVTDKEGCLHPFTYNVLEPDTLIATIALVDTAKCFNSADGSAQVITTLGGNGSYSYSWNSVPVQATPIATGLIGGQTYTMTASDLKGCMYSTSILIPQPTDLTLSTSSTGATCFGDSDGSVTVTPSGANGGYQYLWDAAAGNATTATVNNLPVGTYSVTVTDKKSCSKNTTVTVADGKQLSLTLNAVGVSCIGYENGTAEVTSVQNGDPGYLYQWDDPASSQTQQLSNLPSRMYRVTVTDVDGCMAMDSILVDQPDSSLILRLDAVKHVTCHQGRDGTITLKGTGGRQPYEYSLDSVNFTTNPVFDSLPGGSYLFYSRDNGGCTSSLLVNVIDPAPYVVNAGVDLEVDLGDSVRILAQIAPFRSVVWSWTPSGSLGCDDCAQPYASPLNSTTYNVITIDDFGCEAEDEVFVKVIKNRNIYTPNAFTPNSDGRNDRFFPQGRPISVIRELKVFDRFGGLVHEAKDMRMNDQFRGWDGRVNGKVVNSGVYTYYFIAEFIDGYTQMYKGSVTVLR